MSDGEILFRFKTVQTNAIRILFESLKNILADVNFKADSSTTVDGFFAHEVQEVIPTGVVTGTKDAVVTQALIDAGNQYQQSELNQIIPQQLGTTAIPQYNTTHNREESIMNKVPSTSLLQ